MGLMVGIRRIAGTQYPKLSLKLKMMVGKCPEGDKPGSKSEAGRQQPTGRSNYYYY